VENIKNISEIKLGDVVSISIGDHDKLYFCNDTHVVYSTPLKTAERLLTDKGIVKVGNNFKDIAKKIHITPPVFDITIVSWLLDPNRKSHSLEDIVLQNLHIYSEMTVASIADVVFRLYPILYKKLKSQGEWELYQTIEEPLIFVLSHMEQRGIKIDLAYFEHLGNEIKK
jgi:DNA polymerase-1